MLRHEPQRGLLPPGQRPPGRPGTSARNRGGQPACPGA
jgi:hypothetical protein